MEQPGGTNTDPANQSLSNGFNLFHPLEGQTVPLSTSIPIELTADPSLGFYMCEEIWNGSNSSDAPCHLKSAPPPGPDSNAKISGSLSVDEEGAHVVLWVKEQGIDKSTATVTVNGNEVPSNGGAWGYRLDGEPGKLLKVGQPNFVNWALPGLPLQQSIVYVPGDFSITSPTGISNLTSGQPVTVSWTPSTDAASYSVMLLGLESNYQSNWTTVGTTFTFDDTASFDGQTAVSVRAETQYDPTHPVTGEFVKQIGVNFIP
jgi:hypothetical protein